MLDEPNKPEATTDIGTVKDELDDVDDGAAPSDELDNDHDGAASVGLNDENVVTDATSGKEEEKYSESDTAESEKESPVIQVFSDEDVKIDYRAPLGRGGFGQVYQVHLRDKRTGEFDLVKPFALKQLCLAVMNDPVMLQAASDDLAHEAKILTALAHENVITLYGVRGGDTDASLWDGGFIVLDLLADTLDSRFETWVKNRGWFDQIVPHEIVAKRIEEVVIGIAKGMEYLHSKHIIFRDLKPANVGFDRFGIVKIFDFGLARECELIILNGVKVCRARGRAGTPRYMAPEISYRKGSYGLPADVYSLALLLWQIVTSRVPYENILPSNGMFGDNKPPPEDERPSLIYVESKDLQDLLQHCWASNPDARPTFCNIVLQLQNIVITMQQQQGRLDESDSVFSWLFWQAKPKPVQFTDIVDGLPESAPSIDTFACAAAAGVCSGCPTLACLRGAKKTAQDKD